MLHVHAPLPLVPWLHEPWPVTQLGHGWQLGPKKPGAQALHDDCGLDGVACVQPLVQLHDPLPFRPWLHEPWPQLGHGRHCGP